MQHSGDGGNWGPISFHVCKDGPLGTSIDTLEMMRCDGLPWTAKTGRKRQVEPVERVELVEPTGTGRNSPRKGCEPTKYEDI